jgi:hypothetical protein
MQLFPSFFGSEHAQCAMQRRLKRERNYYGERLGSGRSDTASVQTLAYDTLEAPMMQLFVLCVFVLRFCLVFRVLPAHRCSFVLRACYHVYGTVLCSVFATTPTSLSMDTWGLLRACA